MKKYYFNGSLVTGFSEPKGNSFRDGFFWIKAFPNMEALIHEYEVLDILSSCPGVIRMADEDCIGKVDVVSEDDSVASFPAIKEFYAGEKDIREYCKKHYYEDEIVSLFIQLADILSCVETAGVIHNDVKPSNIIISDEGKPVLIDFNISKKMNEETADLHKYATGNFQAPEKQNGIVSVSGDIYSFGCVLNACMSQNPDNEAYSKGLIEVRKKCCMHDPEQRYGSFAEVKEALVLLESKVEPKTIETFPAVKGKGLGLKEIVTSHLPFLTFLLYGCGVFFISLALYLIFWGADKPTDYSPNLKDDITTVVSDCKTR